MTDIFERQMVHITVHRTPFAASLYSSRKRLRLTQSQAGKLIGVQDTTIADWERGYAVPRVQKIVALCIAFKISPNELFGWEELPAK